MHRKGKESNYPKKVTVLISEKQFIYKSEKNEFTVPWKSITLAVETNEMYIFYSSSISTFYIVKKETDTSTNFSEFDRTIKNILTENSILLK
ncbi:YcxB family protein [Desemzia sp. FAM 23991]|uniref:YcxB family protein n=1 Tax=unclassified Desemzia TaxID=2685243 RepID=UPI0038858436